MLPSGDDLSGIAIIRHMSSDPDSFNPYQPPAVQEVPEPLFGEDTEFLISCREILCRENVTLPRKCIHTGDTGELEKRRKLLHRVASKSYVLASGDTLSKIAELRHTVHTRREAGRYTTAQPL